MPNISDALYDFLAEWDFACKQMRDPAANVEITYDGVKSGIDGAVVYQFIFTGRASFSAIVVIEFSPDRSLVASIVGDAAAATAYLSRDQYTWVSN